MMEVDEVSTTTGGAYDNTNSSDGEETIALMQAQIDIQKEKINDLVEHTEQLKTQVNKIYILNDYMDLILKLNMARLLSGSRVIKLERKCNKTWMYLWSFERTEKCRKSRRFT